MVVVVVTSDNFSAAAVTVTDGWDDVVAVEAVVAFSFLTLALLFWNQT